MFVAFFLSDTPFAQMEDLKNIFRLFVNPASAMSDILDGGSWLFAAVAVLAVSFVFFAAINAKLDAAYHIPQFTEFYHPSFDEELDAEQEAAIFEKAEAEYNAAMANRVQIPIFGDRFFSFFSFETAKFFEPLLLLSVFYVPAAIFLLGILGGVGSFGLVLRRDYGPLSVCALTAWAAAHLPFAVAGSLLYSQQLDPQIYLALWTISGVVFGVFMVFALRTVFGVNYIQAIATVGLAWLAMSLGMHIFNYVSPWLFSPFLIFYAFLYFGGSVSGEVLGFGNALRQKRNFKRFLHNATVNPKDADAHVQLGLIYSQRRQEAKAAEHFNKAIEIDAKEIDANYELGKIARKKGELQTALDHFAIVVEQNDRHALSEVWREIGATYLAGNMFAEAGDALEKFVERRSADPEGLYYLGKVYKGLDESEKAREMFDEVLTSAKTSPDFRRQSVKQWSKLAQKEL
jgi:tetratricopeptide (TPR) repeat protein